MAGDRDPAMDDEQRCGVGDRGGGDAAAFLEMQATDVGIAAAVGQGHEMRAGGTELTQRIGGALSEVDDAHRLSSRCSLSCVKQQKRAGHVHVPLSLWSLHLRVISGQTLIRGMQEAAMRCGLGDGSQGNAHVRFVTCKTFLVSHAPFLARQREG